MCCSFFFMISIALKLVSKTLGVKESLGTLGWKWQTCSKGLFGLPLCGSYSSWTCLKILLRHGKDWTLECLEASSKFIVVGCSWENLKISSLKLLIHIFSISKTKISTRIGYWFYTKFVCCWDIHICRPW
jgi:hypothetical protein